MGNEAHEREDEAHILLSPPLAGLCPECATEHDPAEPHDMDSLYYRHKFRRRHGRFPTWGDAMAHCTDDVRARWTAELEARGMTVET